MRWIGRQASNIMGDVSNMISAIQIKAARLFVGWEQKDLAEHSGLSLPTIQRMEKLGVGRSTADNADRVRKALEGAGIIFLEAGEATNGGPGVRMKVTDE